MVAFSGASVSTRALRWRASKPSWALGISCV